MKAIDFFKREGFRLHCWSSAACVLVKHKRAILVLVYSFAGSMMLTYLLTCDYCYVGDLQSYNVAIASIIAVFYPLAGWLADVRFGRYTFVKTALVVMWVAMLVSATSEVLSELGYLTSYYAAIQTMKYCICITALGGFQANIVQLGIDQLFDASSVEIVSYINWYIWVFFLSNSIFHFFQGCLCEEYKSIVEFVVLFSISMTLLFDYIFCKELIKEPATLNPLKLIYKVLMYSKRNKYPRLRSAFTYWEDKPYSRIDLAKCKFGGPFTTEQVEDVKTFFRMLVMIVGMSGLISLVFVLSTVVERLMLHYRDMLYESECSFTVHYWRNCSYRMSVERFGYSIMVIVIPILDFLGRSFCSRVVAFCSIAKKMTAGVTIILVSNVSLVLLEVASHAHTQRVVSKSQVDSIPCLFLANSSDVLGLRTLSVGYIWLLIPNMLNGLALYVVIKAAIEFLCAQSPFSMKGLLIGVTYATVGLSILIASFLKRSMKELVKHSRLVHNCGTWYFSIILVLSIFILVVVSIMIKKYSRRRRDEDIHNEQIFAVDYYDRYVQLYEDNNTSEDKDLDFDQLTLN